MAVSSEQAGSCTRKRELMWLIEGAGYGLLFELNLGVKKQCSVVGFCEQALNFGASLKVGSTSMMVVNSVISIWAQLCGVN
jgi:hypothetical protein